MDHNHLTSHEAAATDVDAHATRAHKVGIAAVLGAVALAVLLGWSAGLLGTVHEDLEVYRFGFEAWLRGDELYGPLPETSAGVALPFLYPPFAVLMLGPLALLPWAPALVLLFTLNILCVIATIYVVSRAVVPSLSHWHAMLIAAATVPLALLLEPLRETFSFGQINLLLMGLVAVDCLAKNPRWPRGIGVGLAAAIKLTPAAFMLFFLIRQDYRSAIVATVTGCCATLIGFAIAFDDSVRYWFSGFDMMSWMSGTPYLTNQTVEASLARYNLGEPVHTVTFAVLVLFLLLVSGYVMRNSDPGLALVVNAALALLASPTSWSHHWVWAAPALIVFACHTALRWRQGSPAVASWLCVTTLTAALFFLAPFHSVPGAGDAELEWTISEQFLGNSYAWFSATLLIGYASTVWFLRRTARRSQHFLD